MEIDASVAGERGLTVEVAVGIRSDAVEVDVAVDRGPCVAVEVSGTGIGDAGLSRGESDPPALPPPGATSESCVGQDDVSIGGIEVDPPEMRPPRPASRDRV